MENKKLYAITALYDDPDKIIKVAKKVAESGFKTFDVNSSYPLHGIDKAMKLNRSPLGFFALAFGLTGTLLALTFIYYTMVLDYPNIIGGKPFFSFPAFVPVMFEVTVLLASIGTVAALIVYFAKLPNLSHPLHETDYMKEVSLDKFGIYIKADDPAFDEKKIFSLFEEFQPIKIKKIYWDEQRINYQFKLFDKKFITIATLTAILVSLSTYFILNKLLYIEPFNWMSEQEKLTVQKGNNFFADGFAVRTPPKGVVAKNSIFYPYEKAEDAEAKLVNPLIFTRENLELGKKKYDIYCSPCHGYRGEGDSRLRGQFPNPPSLHTETALSYKDGRIYHIITKGQNIMPGYSYKLDERERWAIVLYIRSLQRSLNAKESDINERATN